MILNIASLPAPEKAAEGLLAKSSQCEPPLSFKELLTLLPGVRMSEENLDGSGYLVDLGKQGAEILLKSSDPLVRKRFTAAHELGHWVLRSHGFPLTSETNEALRVAIEKWCDSFAAAVLMPQSWILNDLKDCSVLGSMRFLLEAPEDYEVSDEAFRLRVCEIVPMSLCEVHLRGNRLLLERIYPSRFFDSGIVESVARRAAALPPLQRAATGHFVDHQTKLDVVFQAADRAVLLCVIDSRKMGVQIKSPEFQAASPSQSWK